MKLCYEINEETAKKVNVKSYNEKLNNSIEKMITIVPKKSMYSGIRIHIKSDKSDKSYIFIRLNDFELNIIANSEKISTDMTLIVKRQIDGLTTDYFKLDANSDSTFFITISENDDILDTGRTIQAVKTKLMAMGAKSVSVCVLLDKPTGRLVDIKPDYVGGIVPNEFVVGYGLDYNEHYRNLPYIGVLKDEVYSK